MGTQVGIVPAPHEVQAQAWAYDRGRMRVIRLGDDSTLHVPSRAVLDALQAALDVIRADMDAAAPCGSTIDPATGGPCVLSADHAGQHHGTLAAAAYTSRTFPEAVTS